MKHTYSVRPPRWVPRPLAVLGLLLGMAGAAHAQVPTFAPAIAYSTVGTNPNAVAVADVNGDGKLDLLTANYGDNTTTVLLGNGNGTFQAGATYPTGANSQPLDLAVADVNADGKLDLLTANRGNNTAGVLLGNGNGTFQAAATYSTGTDSQPHAIAVADVNGDSKPDLLTANAYNNTAGVLLGNGNGTFGPVTSFSTGRVSDPFDIVVADVNGDGLLDLLTANSDTQTVAVLLGTGTGTFQAAAAYSTSDRSHGQPYGLAVADVNGDGLLDLLTANYGSRMPGVGVLLGTGNGTFGPVTNITTGTTILINPVDIAVADVNGDGKPDLLTASNEGGAGVLLGNGNGTFQPITTFSAGGTNTDAIAVADVNGDGKPDLLAANYGSNTAGVLLNTTGLASTLTSFSPATGPVGTVVTLTGTNLGSVTAVSFNGTAARSFVATSATSIIAVVAAGTTTGPVTITTPTGTATSTIPFVVRVAPTTVADTYTTPVGVTLTGNVLTNDLGTNPRAILIIRPTHGTLLLNPDGTFTYQPAAGYAGPDSFIYYACDPAAPLLCGNPVTVTINVVRVAPITVADSYSTPQNTTLTGNVLTNDIGTNPQAILILRPTHGTLLLNPDGTFTYQPNAGYVGTDSFIYYACNMGTPLVCGDPATVTITVRPASTATRVATATAAKTGTQAAAGVAQELALTGSPNPFSNELRVQFALPTTQAYTLAVYDGQGRLVQQLPSGQAEAGQVQQVEVPTSSYATGLYLVRLTTVAGSQLLKVIRQ